jgi:rhodanese-related sulfurtransferase
MSARAEALPLERLPRRERVCMLPQALDEKGLMLVDATWGAIQPMTLVPGVKTIGELELIEHVRAGRQLIDTRRAKFVAQATIPGAVAIAHTEIEEHLDELDPEQPVAMFCNGPQCAATPDAVRRLLAAGRRPALILYYRGGMHDWMTLGLPVERSGGPSEDAPRRVRHTLWLGRRHEHIRARPAARPLESGIVD